MSERIQPQINRTFDTGTGNWTGNVGWEPGPIGGKTGLLQLRIEEPTYHGEVQLQYPYIKPIPGKENTLHYEVALQGPEGPEYIGDGMLSDGNYELPIGPPVLGIIGIWFETGGSFDLPSDWNIEQTTLRIWFEPVYEQEAQIVFDNFSFTAEAVAKIQYLPLVGVG